MAEVVALPKMSDTMEEGTLVKWHVKLGDKIKSGDVLAEVETDKATMDLESYYDGEVLYVGANQGDIIKVNTPILVIGKKGEDYSQLLNTPPIANSDANKGENSVNIEKKNDLKNRIDPNHDNTDKVTNRLKASPLAKKIALEKGLDITTIAASTQNGRIIKRDIENALSVSKTNETSFSTGIEEKYRDESLSQMRKVIASRLSESKFTAPHFYVKQEINVDSLVKLRSEINSKLDIKISFNDFVVKAIAFSLSKHADINASFLGDKIRYYRDINIGIAVAIEDGLVVPVVKNVNEKSLSQISIEIKNIAVKARDKKITPADMQDSTFTISNLGMYGIREFTSIINPPNACILAVGAITKTPIVDDNDNIKVANVMTVVLSADHRVVDGAKGAEFLQTLKQSLEEPLSLLI